MTDKLDLMRADRLLAATELEEKYREQGGEHPKYMRFDWREARVRGNANLDLGYWQWVEQQLEQED